MVKNQSIYIVLSVILSSQIMLGSGGGGYKGEQFVSDPHWVGTHSRCVQLLIQRKQQKIEQLRKTQGNEKQIIQLQQEVRDLSGRESQRAHEALDRGQRGLVQESLHRQGDQDLLNIAQVLQTAQGQFAVVNAVRNVSSSPCSKKAQKVAQESIKKTKNTE